jgi:hypothetical protein
MDRLQLVSILAAAGLLVIVLELVRRRRLLERYALLWLLAALVIMVLAVWRGALEAMAKLFGIVYAPNSIFFIAVGFIVVLLLHFSAAVSRLTDQSKVLAQRLSLLEERVRDVEGVPAPTAEADADAEEYDEIEPFQRFVR